VRKNLGQEVDRYSFLQETPDVRTCYIHFLLSFLVEANPGVIKEYFDRKTRLGKSCRLNGKARNLIHIFSISKCNSKMYEKAYFTWSNVSYLFCNLTPPPFLLDQN
jgi:hypothetical protein